MKTWIVVLWLASGCGAVLCSFTANAIGNCPALKQAAAQSQAQSSPAPETSAEPESSPSEPAESSESKAPEASPAKPEPRTDCRASGSVCDQSYQCCSEACVTHSPDDYCR